MAVFEADDELRNQSNKHINFFVPYANDTKMKLFIKKTLAEKFDNEVNKLLKED